MGVVLALLLAVIGGAIIYARPLLKTGTGYAAHNACAVALMADRADPAADLPANPLVPYMRTRVNSADGTARSAILGVLYPQTAYYTPSRGCTLDEKRPDLAEITRATPRLGAPWSSTSASPAVLTPPAAKAAVDSALDGAFGVGRADAQALGTRAVVVVHNGKIVAERYADGFGPGTRQLGWSMAKSAANLVTGALESKGVLKRTDTDLLPEWSGDDRSRISITHLMQMTAGLEWDETYALGTPITRMLYLEKDMSKYAASLPAAYPPGTHLQYSSGSTNILCRILAQRTKDPANMFSQNLFDQIDMTSAIIEPDAAGTPVCSSYLWATPRDWAKMGQLALQNGRWGGTQLVPTDWMAFSSKPSNVPGTDPNYAAGWWTNQQSDGLYDPNMPADTYWASGHDGQQVIVVPSADMVVVRMGFTPTDLDTGTGALVGSLITALTSD